MIGSISDGLHQKKMARKKILFSCHKPSNTEHSRRYIIGNGSINTILNYYLLEGAVSQSRRRGGWKKKDNISAMNQLGNNDSSQSNDALLQELNRLCCKEWPTPNSPCLSELSLRAIIERYGVTPDSNDITNYTFFHEACRNERVTEGILHQYLLEYFPNAIRYVDEDGRLPIHTICRNRDPNPFERIFGHGRGRKAEHVTLGVVKVLVDAFPDSLSLEDRFGYMPLHYFCLNQKILHEEVALKILKFLLKRCPESVRHTTTENRMLPIHLAARRQSHKFCRRLIKAYPGSEQVANSHGTLPFHFACQFNTVATAKYLYKLYPESIHAAIAANGSYPIHCVVAALEAEDNGKMVQFLLDCDPNVASQEARGGKLPLSLLCNGDYEGLQAFSHNTAGVTHYVNVWSLALKVLKILYDAYPEAIERNEVTSNVGNFHREIQTFVNSQLIYAQQARDHSLMTTRDENGQLPLHRALRGNVTLGSIKLFVDENGQLPLHEELQSNDITLGSIKLLVKGNPSAVQSPDNDGALPLHLATQRSESAMSISIVKYLAGLDPTTLGAVDEQGNIALHYACHGAKHKMIALLTETYGAVSKRNLRNERPIHLLLESNEVRDREGIEYTDSIFRLIRAYPETVMKAQSEQATIGQKQD